MIVFASRVRHWREKNSTVTAVETVVSSVGLERRLDAFRRFARAGIATSGIPHLVLRNTSSASEQPEASSSEVAAATGAEAALCTPIGFERVGLRKRALGTASWPWR